MGIGTISQDLPRNGKPATQRSHPCNQRSLRMNITPPNTSNTAQPIQPEAPATSSGNSAAREASRPSAKFKPTEKDTSFAPPKAMGRPSGDHRSAAQIIKGNRIFDHLPSSIPKEDLYRHLGDWTANNPDPQTRADAAYNAARVFNYIDDLGSRVHYKTGPKAYRGRIDGQVRLQLPAPHDTVSIVPKTEAALLKAFSEKGYRALGNHGTPLASNNEKITSSKPTFPEGRPLGDKRNAVQILNANPIVQRFVESLANVPNAGAVLNNLKARTGDWSTGNPNAEARANAAYNIAQVANYLNAAPGLNRHHPGSVPELPHTVDGFNAGEVTPRSEAQALIEFSEKGYAALPG